MTLHEPSLSAAPAALSWTDLGLEEGIASIVLPAHTLEVGSSTGEDLDRLFKTGKDLDCVVFVTGGHPTHLVTRERYYSVTGGPYGFTLYQKKPAENVAKASPLIMERGAGIRLLIRRALDRPREDQYDPVIVTEPNGSVFGIVTIKQLIRRAFALEEGLLKSKDPCPPLAAGEGERGHIVCRPLLVRAGEGSGAGGGGQGIGPRPAQRRRERKLWKSRVSRTPRCP